MIDWDQVKAIGVPVLTGVIGVLGTVITVRSRDKSDREQRNVQQASVMMQTQVSRDQAQMNFDASTASNLTERFKALMDGYEHRIDDLTKDLRDYRERVTRLEHDFGIHKSICNGCINYQAYMKDHPNAFSPTA